MARSAILPLTALLLLSPLACKNQLESARHHWIRHGPERNAHAAGAPRTEQPTADVQASSEGQTERRPTLGLSTITPAPVAGLQRQPIPGTRSQRAFQPHVNTAVDTSYILPDEEPRSWNATAIVSLPVVLLGAAWALSTEALIGLAIVGMVGFTLALIGARRARDRERRGKGFAIPALIVSTFILLVVALAVGMGINH